MKGISDDEDRGLDGLGSGKTGKKGDVSWWERDHGMRSESEEYIVGTGKKDVPLEIWESRRVDVESGSVEGLNGSERDLKKEQVRIYDGVGIRGQGEFESTVHIEALGGTKGSG